MSRSLSSTPVLRTALIGGAGVGVAVIVLAAVAGLLAAGSEGMWSGILGAVVGAVFPILTAVSILFANRWYGSPAYLQIFFGIVLGGWLLKFVLVIVAFIVILQFDWVVTIVFYLALIVAAVASLAVDLVVVLKMRLPAVSDVTLPGEDGES